MTFPPEAIICNVYCLMSCSELEIDKEARPPPHTVIVIDGILLKVPASNYFTLCKKYTIMEFFFTIYYKSYTLFRNSGFSFYN